LTASTAFEGNEQTRRVGQRPFQAEITLQYIQDLPGQWQGALLLALTQNVQEGVGEFQIFELEGQDLTGT
jgi:hypothetical protein